ncbi:MAG TPA: hypothetical protein VFN35_01055, partial [Ktedonobacteraceae bacterium]|nr:hypothetical protein [Ktedonobacteraceae bacterium]
HTLTAKDASGYKTAAGKAITVVTPGQSHTPGPNGAPSDDASGTVVASITTSDGADTVTLNITGKADGGTVCRDLDDGQPHQSTGTSSGLTYVETVIATCEGTYKGGKLTYTETVSSDKVELEGGYVCQATKPYILRHLEGTFTDKATVNGTFSSDAVTITCNKGLGSNNTAAGNGTWTGAASMQ